MNEQGKKGGHGCLFYGGIVAAVLFLAIGLAGYLGYRYARNLVNEFTDTVPVTLPTVEMSAEETQRLRDRVATFSRAVDEGKATGPLTVTADEVNALIASNPDAKALKGHVYITLEGTQVNAQVSIPADKLGLKPLRGRYFNAGGVIGVSLRDGLLEVKAKSLSVKGKPVPENFMRQIRNENFAQGFNEDPKFKTALDKLEDIQIKDGKVVIVPKPIQPEQPAPPNQ